MDRMVYLAMSGAKQTLAAQAAVAHNLANASTIGFRADLTALRSMPVFGPGHPSRVFALAERPGVDFTPGALVQTGNPLDVAVDGEGFIAVLAPDGTEAFTRAGDLRLTGNGVLQTAAGHPVLGNAGPIAVPPSAGIEIGTDGTVTVRPVGQDANALAQVDRIKLVRPPLDMLDKGDDGLLRLRDGASAPPDASVRLARGMLERSNVNGVEQMVTMIALQRNFELQVKAMQTAQENESAAAELLRLV